MKLTPIEIRQKQFAKRTLGGIDRDEVDAYLNTVSQAYEKQLEENHHQKERLNSAEREVSKLREIESSLHKTLKAAEETSVSMVEQARQQATLQMRDAELKAENLLKEARWQAKSIIEDARQEARRMHDKVQDEVARLQDDARQAERHRDTLLEELRQVASQILEKAEREQSRTRQIRFEPPSRPSTDYALSPGLEAALQDTNSDGPARALPQGQEQPAEGSFFDSF